MPSQHNSHPTCEGNATVEKASDAIMQICIEDDSKVYLFNWAICVRMNRYEPRQVRAQRLRVALSELSAKLDEWLDGKSEDEAPIFAAADLAAQVARDLRRRPSPKSFAHTEPKS